jgi:hypothetical protein
MPLRQDTCFTVEFEKDLDTLNDLHGQLPPPAYRSRSFGSRSSSKSREGGSRADSPDHTVVEAELSDSFLSAVLSTIQPLDEHKSLLILTVICHPAPGRRFKNCTMTWKFSSTTPLSTESLFPISSPPKLIAIAPQHSIGGWTEEQTRLLWGLTVNAGAGVVGASAGVEPSLERETSKAVMHAMAIQGSIRPNCRACWTVEENKSSERGIPSHFRLAVVLDHSGDPFVMELDAKAELGGSLFHPYMQAKKGRNDLRKVIDVHTWKCGEVAWEPSEAGWKAFMAGMTGEVPGTVVQFEQSIVRP